MTSPYDTYTSPLATRNASPEMLRLWSARHKFNTWRRIWLAVAEAMCEIGEAGATGAASKGSNAVTTGPLVTREQVEELRGVVERTNPDGSVGITDDEIRLAERYERELRHDVMAHVHALGDACPRARAIIHLGMTSQDVVCNADLLVCRAGVWLLSVKAYRIVAALCDAAGRHARIPALAFTHYQAAQPTTVGRRCAQWAYELLLAARRVGEANSTPLKGLRGATGTQASFLALMDGDGARVDAVESRVIRALLNEADPALAAHAASDLAAATGLTGDAASFLRSAMTRLASDAGFLGEHTHRLVTQTYPRVIDTFILADLASVAAVLHKIATDIRLLSNRKELDEPFEDKQIGSSAMPYKRNPMRCERVCGLTRFVMSLVGNAYDTAATQWLERTLDDSSNRRLSLPEAFLALDGALDLMHNVVAGSDGKGGLIVHEAMVRKNLMGELPFMATENILMACVRAGGDRQEYHEKIRVHAQAAGWRVKHEGLDNDLLDRLKSDRAFWSRARGGPLSHELDWSEGDGGLLDPMRYIGRSVEQTERFIREVVEPMRGQYKDAIEGLGQSGPRV